MSVWSSLLAVVLALGAIQGIVFGAILFRSTELNQWANRWLAILLWLLSYRLLVQTMRLFGLGYYDTWYYFMLDLSWVTGPLLYFYVRAQTQPNFSLYRTDWIHFVPLLLQIMCSIYVRLQNIYWDGTRESLSWLGYWGYVVWMNYSTIYVVASGLIIFYVFKAKTLLNQRGIDLKIGAIRKNWLLRILTAFKIYFAVILVILLGDLLIHKVALGNNYFYFVRFYYFPFFIGISLLTYWLGVEGFMRKDDAEPIKKPSLTNTKIEQLKNISTALEDLMTVQKIYREPGLSLREVAERLAVKEYLLSQAMNEIMGIRFIDYINKLRINDVQMQLAQPEMQQQPLLDLALAAGFNSKSTFNRAVKKQLGIAPHELKAKDS